MNTKYIIRIALAAVAAVLLLVLLLKNNTSVEQKQNVVQFEEPKENTEQIFKLTPSRTSVSGPLNDFFEVVDRVYKSKNGKLNVELKRIKEGFPEPWESGMQMGYSAGCFEPGFYIEVMDADGDVIRKDETSVISDRHDLLALAELNEDETTTISFFIGYSPSEKFRIGSAFKVNEKKEKEEQVEEDEREESTEQSATQTNTISPAAAVDEAHISDYENENTDQQYDVDEDDSYDDDELDEPEEKSLWQKVKDKSKKTYKKTKEYSKKIYNKAKRKINEWLDD